MPFAYYDRLNRRDRAIYRKSDEVQSVTLPGADQLREPVDAIQSGLAADDRAAVQRAVRKLATGVTRALEVPRVTVRVLATRPSSSESELHGLYEREDDQTATIRVWMRTAANRRVVAFRTFVRTFLHELCHHLDYELLALADSFHTEGFFRRESSLMRQLVPGREQPAAEPERERSSQSSPAGQLELPLGSR